MKISKAFLVSLVFWLVTNASSVVAQNYSIDWYKIAGGGGTSIGGEFSLAGTIGQHDAGTAMTGGTYSLTGGYWALSAVQNPGAPLLTIFLTDTNTAVVAWPAPSAGWVLQQNGTLDAANWVNSTGSVNLVGGQNQVVVSPPAGNRFFRLVSP